MAINNTLRNLRLEKGLTQEQVAEKLNVTRQAVSSYESGRTRPDVDTLMKFAEIYETDLESIVYGNIKKLKATKTVKITAIISFIIPVLIKLASSIMLWYTHYFLSPYPTSFVSQYFKHLEIANALDTLTFTIAQMIFLVLFMVVLLSKCKILIKTKLVYTALFIIAMFLAAVPFGISDPVVTLTDYLLMPVVVSAVLVFYLVLNLIIEFICDIIRKSKKP